MPKQRTVFICDKCGYESPRWFGKCPSCGEWNSAQEFSLRGKDAVTGQGVNPTGNVEEHPRFFDLRTAVLEPEPHRVSTGLPNLDDLLNGGFVPGQVFLLGGEPGVGKSTLALQICNSVANNGRRAVYASGEESIQQIAVRARRLGVSNENIFVTTETCVERILSGIGPDHVGLIVFDSVQTLSSDEINAPVGGVVQIRAVVEKVRNFAKQNAIPAVLIAHVTKEGLIAGPKLVEHVVDTVVYFEGERTTDYRVLRVQKNRFGPSGELAIFQMTQTGLRSVVEDEFLTYSQTPGNVFTSVFEGSRPLNVQIQALVSRVRMSSGRRISHGIDVRKVVIISALLSKHLNVPLDFHDIYVNVSGGINITDPGCELALAGAILSSFLDARLGNVFMVGEIGLDGSVRSAVNVSKRVENAKKLQMDWVIVPTTFRGSHELAGVKFKRVSHVSQLLEWIVERKEEGAGVDTSD